MVTEDTVFFFKSGRDSVWRICIVALLRCCLACAFVVCCACLRTEQSKQCRTPFSQEEQARYLSHHGVQHLHISVV
jgi:hypothetical protein